PNPGREGLSRKNSVTLLFHFTHTGCSHSPGILDCLCIPSDALHHGECAGFLQVLDAVSEHLGALINRRGGRGNRKRCLPERKLGQIIIVECAAHSKLRIKQVYTSFKHVAGCEMLIPGACDKLLKLLHARLEVSMGTHRTERVSYQFS